MKEPFLIKGDRNEGKLTGQQVYNDILNKCGVGWYQARSFFTAGGFLLADGANIQVLALVLMIISKE